MDASCSQIVDPGEAVRLIHAQLSDEPVTIRTFMSTFLAVARYRSCYISVPLLPVSPDSTVQTTQTPFPSKGHDLILI